jgi:hypothetical protein
MSLSKGLVAGPMVLLLSLIWVLSCQESGGATDASADSVVGVLDVTPIPDVATNACSATLTLGEPVLVVPSSGLPVKVAVDKANNNLDVIEHGGRYYLAFRSAPSHFASPETRLFVVSSVDKISWDYELNLHLGTDVREPRFVSLGQELVLFYAVLGESPMDFQPQGMMSTTRSADGEWSSPDWAYLEGFIPWRARVLDGVPQLMGYVGGADIYDSGESGLAVHWLRVLSPTDFAPMVPGQPVVISGGVSETDFAFLPDGRLLAVARNEEGDDDGFGSKICTAAADALGEWECAHDPRKYDSPLVFTQGQRVFLVARRNVTETGYFDLGRSDLPADERFLAYQLAYWETPKRCAIWEVDAETLTVQHLTDLPSAGDTCFPSLLRISENEVELWNYTSPLADPDISWFEGQTGETFIYRIKLAFGCDDTVVVDR